MNKKTALIFAFLLFIPSTLKAKVFSWPDAQGQNAFTESETEGCNFNKKIKHENSQTKPLSFLPENGILVGLYSIATTQYDEQKLPKIFGYSPKVVFTFHDWISDDDFSKESPHLRTLLDPMEGHKISPLEYASNDKVLALTWAIQCCNWTSTSWWFGFGKTQVTAQKVLEGKYDAYIRTVAKQVKAFQKPILLSLFSEFNMQATHMFGPDGTKPIHMVDNICNHYGDPELPDGSERIKDVHKYIIDIFREEGANNAIWFMYAASGFMNPKNEDYSPWLHPKFSYPGDEYIDFVGQSLYFSDPSWPTKINDDATSFEDAINYGYAAWSEVTDKPMFLPEFGALGNEQYDRSSIISDVMTNKLPKYKRVKLITFAESELFEICCQLPRLGRFYPDEIITWQKNVAKNDFYEK